MQGMSLIDSPHQGKSKERACGRHGKRRSIHETTTGVRAGDDRRCWQHPPLLPCRPGPSWHGTSTNQQRAQTTSCCSVSETSACNRLHTTCLQDLFGRCLKVNPAGGSRCQQRPQARKQPVCRAQRGVVGAAHADAAQQPRHLTPAGPGRGAAASENSGAVSGRNMPRVQLRFAGMPPAGHADSVTASPACTRVLAHWIKAICSAERPSAPLASAPVAPYAAAAAAAAGTSACTKSDSRGRKPRATAAC